MKVSTISLDSNILRCGLSVALAVSALTILSARAHASDLDPMMITAIAMQTVGYDSATGASLEDITVEALIAADAETLKNASGVVLLNDRVVEAAVKVCNAADPLTTDN